MTKSTQLKSLMIDLEAQLRQQHLWQTEPPSETALASVEPFCIDTLTFPQWLQFVFLPTIYRMLEENSALPAKCSIAPMAEEYFRGSELSVDELAASLKRVDQLITDA